MGINCWQWHDAAGRPHFGVSAGADPTALVDVTQDLDDTIDSLDAAWERAGTVDELVAMAKRWLTSPVPRRSRAGDAFEVPVCLSECWAAGVTYADSRTARMEETQGAEIFYDAVYAAERPEIFFKAPGHRVVGPGAVMGLRPDATWHVPEPELTVILAPNGQVVGYTAGNDLSARDIEGENPLYLPQAKMFDHSAAIGPSLVLAPTVDPLNLTITLTMFRGSRTLYQGSLATSQMHRPIGTLVHYLRRAWSLAGWTGLMTGTALVPPSDIALTSGDVVDIAITEIGTLRNPVKVITTNEFI